LRFQVEDRPPTLDPVANHPADHARPVLTFAFCVRVDLRELLVVERDDVFACHLAMTTRNVFCSKFVLSRICEKS